MKAVELRPGDIMITPTCAFAQMIVCVEGHSSDWHVRVFTLVLWDKGALADGLGWVGGTYVMLNFDVVRGGKYIHQCP